MDKNNTNPFAAKPTGTREVPQELLGSVSGIPDNMEQELKNIEHLVPASDNASVEEGFQKMLNILGKQPPTPTHQSPQTTQQPQQFSVFNKVQQKPEEDIKNEIKVSNSTDEKDIEKKEEDKPKTQSEILGLHYKDEEILPLIDSILQKGYASETIYIKGNKIIFRSTFSWEEQEIVTRIDNKISEGMNLKSTGSYFYELYGLAANLEQFGANYFPAVTSGTEFDKKKSFDDRVEFLSNISSTLLTIISIKRAEFLKKLQFLVDNSERLLKAF